MVVVEEASNNRGEVERLLEMIPNCKTEESVRQLIEEIKSCAFFSKIKDTDAIIKEILRCHIPNKVNTIESFDCWLKVTGISECSSKKLLFARFRILMTDILKKGGRDQSDVSITIKEIEKEYC